MTFNTISADVAPLDIAWPARICISTSGISDKTGNISRASSLSDTSRSAKSTSVNFTAIFCNPRSPIFTWTALTSSNCASFSSICLAISDDFSNVAPIGARAVILISFASVDGANSLPTNFISIADATNATTDITTTRHGCACWKLYQRRIIDLLAGVFLSSGTTVARTVFASLPFDFFPDFLFCKRKILAIIIGVNVNENNSDNNVKYTTVKPNWFMNWPAIPPINANGKNTTTFVPTPANTETATFLVPSIAAVSGSLPFCISCNDASIKIMAFDTNVPSADEYANSVNALIVKLLKSMKKNPAINDAGITTPAIIVERQLRVNANKTNTVNITPRIIPSIVPYVSSATDTDESATISMRASGKRDSRSAWNSGIRARKSRDILMALPSDALTTDAIITSWPL